MYHQTSLQCPLFPWFAPTHISLQLSNPIPHHSNPIPHHCNPIPHHSNPIIPTPSPIIPTPSPIIPTPSFQPHPPSLTLCMFKYVFSGCQIPLSWSESFGAHCTRMSVRGRMHVLRFSLSICDEMGMVTYIDKQSFNKTGPRYRELNLFTEDTVFCEGVG